MAESTEAPASINFRLSYKGVSIQITNRDTDEELKPFFLKAKTAIDWALTNGFELEVKKSFGNFPPKKEKEYIEGDLCPKDGGRLIKPPEGTKIPIKCENSKWDHMTKTASGCDYTKWANKS